MYFAELLLFLIAPLIASEIFCKCTHTILFLLFAITSAKIRKLFGLYNPCRLFVFLELEYEGSGTF